MSRKGIPGDRFANFMHREFHVACKRCTKAFKCVGMIPRKYCDECLPIVTRERKQAADKRNRAKRPKRSPSLPKPRLVRYAGYDPSERNR